MVVQVTIADREKGHFKGESVPFGALVDFMPQNDMKHGSMANRAIQGVFFGNHVHAVGVWSGDYYVADYGPFKKDCDVVKSKVNIHRTKGCRAALVECSRPRRRPTPGTSAQR